MIQENNASPNNVRNNYRTLNRHRFSGRVY